MEPVYHIQQTKETANNPFTASHFTRIDLRLDSFIPGLLVPPAAAPSITGAFLAVLGINYTLSSSRWNENTKTFCRLVLASIGIILFFDFGYGDYPTPQSGVDVGMSVIGIWGIARVIDAAIIALFDASPPTWVRSSTGQPIPPPATVLGRVGWALDLTTSLRGNSWYKDTHWDFCPRSLISSPKTRSTTRAQFLRDGLLSFIIQYICVDTTDTLTKSRIWNRTTAHPLSSLPIIDQVLFTPTVLAQTALAITLPYTMVSMAAVAMGSYPESWPPMFNAPFTASSLADFWSKHWHFMFRRIFDRLSLLPLRLLPKSSSKLVTSTFRALLVFALSATMHVLLMYRVDRTRDAHLEGFHPWTFVDSNILKFFLAQPFGLIIEQLFILPVINTLIPPTRPGWRKVAGRIWTWLFFLWSGRFWADVWIHRGFWDQRERNVGYSVVRGVIWGRWAVESRVF